MNFNRIERKIRKYTYKLKRSTTQDRTNLYQQKLRYYHNLNQYGGRGVYEIIKDLVSKTQIKRDTGEQLIEEVTEEEIQLEILKKQIKKCQIPCEIENGEKLKELEKKITDYEADSQKVLDKILGLKDQFAKMTIV